jgi:hypothetical protein
MDIQLSDILLVLILLFVFLIWLRGNPQYVYAKRKWRLVKKWVKLMVSK